MEPTAPKRSSRAIVGALIALAVLGTFLLWHVSRSNSRTASKRGKTPSSSERGADADREKGGGSARRGGDSLDASDSSRSGTDESGLTALAGAETAEGDEAASSTQGVLRVRLLWIDSVLPVADTPVELRWEDAGATATKVAVTDMQGVATIVHPSEWNRGKVSVRRPRLWFEPASVRLPFPSMLTLHVYNLYSAYGKVFVLDEKGEKKPMEGARVLASGEKSLETQSDAQGSWVMNDLREKAVTFYASHDDLLAGVENQSGPIALDPEKDNGPFDFILKKAGATLSGAVLREDDLAPIAGAAVRSRTLGAETTTDDQGNYCIDSPLPAGRYEFAATASGYGDAVHTIDLREGQDEIAIFHLKKGGTIRALVVDYEDVPVEKAKVHLLDTIGVRRTQATDAQGRTDFCGLDIEDTFTIWSWEDSETSNPQIVILGTKRPEADVKLTMPWALSDQENQEPPVAAFEGTVTDLEDNPIAGVTVQFRQQYAAEAESREADAALSGIDGRFHMEMTWTDGSPYEVSAFGEGWATQWALNVRPGTPEHPTILNFKMPPERWVRGTVVDRKQRPLANARCQIWSGQVGPWANRAYPGQALTYTDKEGKFFISGVDGDYVMVEIYKPGYRAIAGLSAPTGEETVFVLDQMGVIRGRVIDAATNLPVKDFTLRVSGRNIDEFDLKLLHQRHKFFSEDGRFVIDWLFPEEMYRITVEAPRYITYIPREWEWWRAGFYEETPSWAVPDEEAVIKLERAEGLAGVVVDASTQEPISEVAVISGLTRGWKPEEAVAHRENLAYTRTQLLDNAKLVHTGADGRFWFEGKETGTASVLLFWIDGYAPLGLTAGARSMFADSSTGDLKIPLVRGGQIGVSILLEGKPQPGEMAFATSLAGAARVGHLMGVRPTDAAGGTVFLNVPPGPVLVGFTRNRDDDVGFPARSRVVQVAEGQRTNVDLGETAASAVLLGSVKCQNKPVLGVLVKAESVTAGDSFVAHSGTGKDGLYRLVGLPPGTYDVSLIANVTGNKYDSPDYDFPPAAKEVKRLNIAGEVRQNFEIPDFFDD